MKDLYFVDYEEEPLILDSTFHSHQEIMDLWRSNSNLIQNMKLDVLILRSNKVILIGL